MTSKRHLASLALVAFATLFFSALAVTGQHTAQAEVTTFDVALTPSQETPAVPGTYPGSAFARFTFDSSTNVLTYDITVSGLTPNLVTAAHIHRGAPGVAGPVIYFLSPTGFTQASGKITLTDADVADLKAGNFYANVHSTDYPAGFARGQMYLDPGVGIKQTINSAVDAWNQHDTARFINYFTDQGLAANFQTTRKDALNDVGQFIGDPPISFRSLTNLTVSDRVANADMELALGDFVDLTHNQYALDGIWKIDDSMEIPVPLPAAVPVVNLTLGEYSFGYDKAAVASGNVSFKVSNAGQQPHEAALLKLDPGIDLQQAIQSETPPPGIDTIGQAGPWAPGEQSTIVLNAPLSPGRYAFVCFVPDAVDGIPHALKGMTSEFTVGNPTSAGGGTAIRPPSTGDAGLAGPIAQVRLALLALALVSLTAGAGLLARGKRV